MQKQMCVCVFRCQNDLMMRVLPQMQRYTLSYIPCLYISKLSTRVRTPISSGDFKWQKEIKTNTRQTCKSKDYIYFFWNWFLKDKDIDE